MLENCNTKNSIAQIDRNHVNQFGYDNGKTKCIKRSKRKQLTTTGGREREWEICHRNGCEWGKKFA